MNPDPRVPAASSRAAAGRPVSVLIVDDHPGLRSSLRRRLEHDPRYRMCGEADCGACALRLVRTVNPDLVLLDVSLGDEDGLEVLAAIRRERPAVPVLILSMFSEQWMAEPAIAAGANGFLTKADAADYLVEAMDAVLDGRTYPGRGEARPDPAEPPGALQPPRDCGTPPPDEAGTDHHHRGCTRMHSGTE